MLNALLAALNAQIAAENAGQEFPDAEYMVPVVVQLGPAALCLPQISDGYLAWYGQSTGATCVGAYYVCRNHYGDCQLHTSASAAADFILAV